VPERLEFTEESVLGTAREAAGGPSDFGGEGFREGLRVLLETYERTANFSEAGRRRNHRRVVQLLANRLRIQQALERHPEILAREVRRPLVMTGLPRSGTSALFNLLAADPAARPLRLWEALFPWPLDEPPPDGRDPRRDAVEAHYARGRERNPEFTKIHYLSADTPEECVLLLSHDFCDAQMGIEVVMEPYGSWFQKQDLRRTYAYYRQLLKLLDWQRPGERWTLKTPAHLWAIDPLIELFPDVCLVWTHRNPLESTASICSMTAALMAAREGFDPRELGPPLLEYYAASLERGLAARARRDSARFFDADYRRFLADPVGVAESIYAHFGLPLGPGVIAALRRHARENPQGRHGAHEYSLADYGLTPGRVRERFADYIRRYDLPAD